LLSALDGSTVVSNLDIGNWYTGAAFDGAGNLYGCSPTTNYWRAWSPPGANTNTTTAVQQLIVGAVAFKAETATAVSTGPGSASITINFTAPGNPASSAFTIMGSSTVNGTYTAVPGAVVTGSSGSYQATFSVSSSPEFFVIKQQSGGG
jgi:hypothetical protein